MEANSSRESEHLGQAGHAEQLVGQHLGLPHGAGDLDVGLENPLERGARQPLDAPVDGLAGPSASDGGIPGECRIGRGCDNHAPIFEEFRD
jgi:hypothetical protein